MKKRIKKNGEEKQRRPRKEYIWKAIWTNVTVTHDSQTGLIGTLLLWYWLNNVQIAQKDRASFLLSLYVKRKFPQAYYEV